VICSTVKLIVVVIVVLF